MIHGLVIDRSYLTNRVSVLLLQMLLEEKQNQGEALASREIIYSRFWFLRSTAEVHHM